MWLGCVWLQAIEEQKGVVPEWPLGLSLLLAIMCCAHAVQCVYVHLFEGKLCTPFHARTRTRIHTNTHKNALARLLGRAYLLFALAYLLFASTGTYTFKAMHTRLA